MYLYCLRCIKPFLDDATHHEFVCIRTHSVRFSQIRGYLTYSLVFEDEHVRSGVVLLANSRTTGSIRKCSSHKWSLYLWITSNASLIYQNMARMVYRTLRVIHEYSIWIRKNWPDSNRILQVYFESAVIEYVRTLRYTRRAPTRAVIGQFSGPYSPVRPAKI